MAMDAKHKGRPSKLGVMPSHGGVLVRVRVSRALKDALDAAATQRAITLSALVREALEAAFIATRLSR